MAIVPIGILAFLGVFNLIEYIRGIEKKRRWGLRSEKNELTDKEIHKIELNRKIFHFVAMGLLFMVLIIGDKVLRDRSSDPVYAAQLENFWGAKDGLGFLPDVFVRKSIPMGQTLMIMWMYGQTLFLLTFEITRLSKKVHFLFHREVQSWLRYKEIDTFAAYTHFSVGYLLAAIFLPPLLFLASMCMITFADPAASSIGIRFGKHRFSWNKKSWEGLIAGTLACFFTMFMFVGPIYALVGAITFGLIDLATPKPIKASDNIIMPVGATLVFLALSSLGIPCVNFWGF